ncbi:MAG: TonB-dependent receptor [Proteobacteria bacterium]|jgi:iron complex outermembrane receptor protein|nr:TonB-dependent receptor [Pseudomonadota bacterium]
MPAIRTLTTAVALLHALGAGAASTGNALPEIVVTADYRGTEVVSAPTSISVISEEVVRSRAAQHFEEMLGALPNVNFAAGTNRARFFQIRGIGERSQFIEPLNPSVGVLIDNVDYSGMGTAATLLDVDQIEVLRGPQGTRYGANALAGLIHLKTNEPEDAFRAALRLGAGNFDARRAQLMMTGPLTDQSQFRLAVEQFKSDGYYDNAYLGTDDNNRRDELTGRAKLAMAVSEDWDINLTLTRVDLDNGYDAFTLNNTRTTLSDEPGHDRIDATGFSIDSTWQLSASSIEVIAALLSADTQYGYDEDWTYSGFHPDGYMSSDAYNRDRESGSLEVRWISDGMSRIFGDSTDWIIGLYTLDSDEDLRREYTYLARDFISSYGFDTRAIFVQLDTRLTDTLALATGLRAERRDTTYQDSNAVTYAPRENMWGGRIALTYSPDSGSMSYISLARGYKAGGFNTDGTLDADLREFSDESLVEVEVGVKSRSASGRFEYRVAAFYDERTDQQVKSSLVRQRPDGTSEFIDFTGNAATGTNSGVEVELDWFASKHLLLSASGGLLDARFNRFINEFGEDLSGRDQAQAPNYTWHLAVRYERGGWHFDLSAEGRDAFYFSDRHAVRSKPYSLINGSIGYKANAWGIQLWGRNLNDKDYYTRAFGSFNNDPRDGYADPEPYFQFGEPRVFGVTVDFRLNR